LERRDLMSLTQTLVIDEEHMGLLSRDWRRSLDLRSTRRYDDSGFCEIRRLP
jgi:hypothetical protein